MFQFKARSSNSSAFASRFWAKGLFGNLERALKGRFRFLIFGTAPQIEARAGQLTHQLANFM